MFKRKYRITVMTIILLLFLSFLTACNSGDNDFNNFTDENNPAGENNLADEYNFVDERFELVSLVFRLAGKPEYGDDSKIYQRRINSTFSEFKEHPVVIYTAENLHFGYDAVFRMAIHMEKDGDGFVLLDNYDFLFDHPYEFSRWTRENSEVFIELLNDFYIITNFSGFFHENNEFYLRHSMRFTKAVYNNINFEWFSQYGFCPDNMRIVLSPAKKTAVMADGFMMQVLMKQSYMRQYPAQMIIPAS